MKELHKRLLTGFLLSVFVIGTIVLCPAWVFAAITAFLLLIILVSEWPYLAKGPYFWLITPLYPVLPFVLIIIMQLTGYELVNLLLLSMVAIHDTGSYLAGKLWGKHKISPEISPGKTWEGFGGGIILTFLAICPFFAHAGNATLFLQILPFTIMVCSSALCGDLFESYLKRRAGVKDSGTLLPGHGGILDRVDGIMFAVPVVFLLRTHLAKLLSGITLT